MINYLKQLIPSPKAEGFIRAGIPLILALMSPSMAHAATHYKKQSVVDFEGALVEGKSRKPYSAYLSQQKSDAFNDTAAWELDLHKRVQLDLEKVGHGS